MYACVLTQKVVITMSTSALKNDLKGPHKKKEVVTKGARDKQMREWTVSNQVLQVHLNPYSSCSLPPHVWNSKPKRFMSNAAVRVVWTAAKSSSVAAKTAHRRFNWWKTYLLYREGHAYPVLLQQHLPPMRVSCACSQCVKTSLVNVPSAARRGVCVISGHVSAHVERCVSEVMKYTPGSGWALSSEPGDTVSRTDRQGENELALGLSPPITLMGQVTRKQRPTQAETNDLRFQNKGIKLRH